MRKICNVVAIILTAAIILTCMTGCFGEKGAVNKLLNKFEAACRAADADAILDCINPTIANPVRSTLSLFGVGSLNSALDTVLGLVGLIDLGNSNPAEVLSSVRITPKSHTFNSEKNKCDVAVEVIYSTGTQTVTNMYIVSCAKYADEWYITSIG